MESGSELRSRAIFLPEFVLLFAMRALFVFLTLHLHQDRDLLPDVVDDCDRAQLAKLLALRLKSLWLVQVNLSPQSTVLMNLPHQGT